MFTFIEVLVWNLWIEEGLGVLSYPMQLNSIEDEEKIKKNRMDFFYSVELSS